MNSIDSRYDGVIQSQRRRSTEAIGGLNALLEEANCRFGNAVIPCFYKPYFLPRSEERRLQTILSNLLSMLEKVTTAYFTHPEIRLVFGIPKDAREVIAADPGYSRNIVIARPDGFLHGGVFRFVELNCDSPAGPGYADRQERIFRDSFMLKELGRHYRWGRPRRLSMLLKALLDCYREYGGRDRYPHIAIVDWRGLRTQNEFEIIRDEFESRGYPCRVIDPRELVMRKGRLTSRGFRVDLIYRRVIFRELLEKRDEVKPFLRAYATGRVCVVNPLRSRLAASKAALTILTNPAYDYLFTREEIRTRDRHLPWTRRVVDAKRFYGGRALFLERFIQQNKRRLVLKPAEGYGGRDVAIGNEVSTEHWNRLLHRAIRGGEHWVVQEKLAIPRMTVPVVRGGRLRIVAKKVNVNPFVFGGKLAGAIARLSDATVINVSAGGGLIPTVRYDRR